MSRPLVIPVRDVNRAVRATRAIHWPKPDIVRGQQLAAETALETGPVAFQDMPIDCVGEQITRDVNAVELRWKSASLIEDSAIRDVAAFEPGVRDMIEVAERVRIVQRPVFAETFDIVAALHLVEPDLLAEIRSRDDVAVLVEIESPGVAAPFGEKLELMRERMVTPNALLKFEAANVSGYRAPLRAIEPAVGPPGQ